MAFLYDLDSFCLPTLYMRVQSMECESHEGDMTRQRGEEEGPGSGGLFETMLLFGIWFIFYERSVEHRAFQREIVSETELRHADIEAHATERLQSPSPDRR